MRNINYKIVFTLASVCPWCFIIFCEVKLYTLLLPLFDPCLNPFPAIDPALLLSFCLSLCSNPRTLVWPLFLLLGIFLKLRVLLNLCLPTSLIVIPGISDWQCTTPYTAFSIWYTSSPWLTGIVSITWIVFSIPCSEILRETTTIRVSCFPPYPTFYPE